MLEIKWNSGKTLLVVFFTHVNLRDKDYYLIIILKTIEEKLNN